MATYKASPFYNVKINDKAVSFDFSGTYATEDEAEIAALNALCPTWIKRVDEAKTEEPAPKRRQPSAK